MKFWGLLLSLFVAPLCFAEDHVIYEHVDEVVIYSFGPKYEDEDEVWNPFTQFVFYRNGQMIARRGHYRPTVDKQLHILPSGKFRMMWEDFDRLRIVDFDRLGVWYYPHDPLEVPTGKTWNFPERFKR